ncbi:hemicentin-2-like isoform X1 [Dermacentor silvarum]|uniref:hemicentin-2-like isoform X1 n=1 Tax=Dermacentor silvarum TaxID=543639 RepID=UPI002100858C|nr:hemicentin-2-like isoform X1 [Dermacentor silvarum]
MCGAGDRCVWVTRRPRHWSAALFGVVLLLGCWSRQVGARYQAVTAEAQTVTALDGSQVQLSCDISAPGVGDFPVRIRWFKDSSPNPVYSVDVNPRTGSLSQIRQSAQRSSLQGRAYFSVIQTPAVLSIDRLRHADNGSYVCAVDFKKDWTRKLTTHLIVIVPPKRPVIMDENGTKIDNITRPYLEGEDLTLTCDVYDGQPEPVVTWWRGSELLQQALSRTSGGHPRATLFRLRLTRADYQARLTCRATNSNITLPVATTIVVNMHLKPVSVEIKGPRGPLSAELPAQVICQVNGSRPEALVRWFLGPYQLNDTETHVISPNTTLGVLNFVPGDRDHGARLRCLASNSAIGGAQGSTSAPLEDSWILDVHYKPVVQLRLGSGLSPSNIHEGIDIYFECSVRSNPPVSEVSWTFDGRDLHTDGARGIIVSNQSLALRSVNRTNSGFYACHAANSEGEAESNRLRLRVLHSPVCQSGHRQHSHSVAKHETVEVECDVEADPSNVTFSWTFHQAHRTAALSPNASFSTPPGAPLRSVLRYTPRSDTDYGTLYCRARNAVGDSLEPCIFQIHPVGPPVTPFNCSVEEVTSEGVHVVCQRSGAGQQQTFLLELQDGQSTPIVTNFTSGQPSFRVHSLRPATRYQMALYGINANGRSEPVHLTVFTLPVGRGLVSKADTEWSLGSTTLWAAALSAVAAFLIVFIALTLGKFRRKILFNRAQNVWNRNERECNHVPHDLVEGNLDLGTELMAFDPPAMITFKDPLSMKPALNGSNGTILGLSSQPKGRVPSPS